MTSACGTGFRSDGTGLVCIGNDDDCAAGYRENGLGVCTSNSQPEQVTKTMDSEFVSLLHPIVLQITKTMEPTFA